MKLIVEIGFVHPSRYDKNGILECDVRLLADERFGCDDYANQAHFLPRLLRGNDLHLRHKPSDRKKTPKER